MDADTVQDWIMAGNSAAMDWFALTHDQPLPSQSLLERTLGADFGAVSPTVGLSARGITGTQILITLGVIAVAIYLFRKT
jgi:hypothetical protein